MQASWCRRRLVGACFGSVLCEIMSEDDNVVPDSANVRRSRPQSLAACRYWGPWTQSQAACRFGGDRTPAACRRLYPMGWVDRRVAKLTPAQPRGGRVTGSVSDPYPMRYKVDRCFAMTAARAGISRQREREGSREKETEKETSGEVRAMSYRAPSEP